MTDGNADQTNNEVKVEDKGSDDSWKSETKVPYDRFENVVRANQEFRDKYSAEISEIKEMLSTLKTSKTETNAEALGEWDKKIRSMKSWDELMPELESHMFTRFEQREIEKRKSVEKEFEKEVDDLKTLSGLSKDEDIDKVIKFANEKSEKLGRTIPLSVAFEWMEEAGKIEAKEKSEAREEASRKFDNSKRSSGVDNQENKSYSQFKGQTLSDIIQKAKEEISAS